MEYAKLGHSGIDVSRICAGGMSFGAPDPNHHAWTLGPEETYVAHELVGPAARPGEKALAGSAPLKAKSEDTE